MTKIVDESPTTTMTMIEDERPTATMTKIVNENPTKMTTMIEHERPTTTMERPTIVDESPTMIMNRTAEESSTALIFYGLQGHQGGVCDSWDELQRRLIQQRIAGITSPTYQPFSTWQAAKEYVLDDMWKRTPAAAKRFTVNCPQTSIPDDDCILMVQDVFQLDADERTMREIDDERIAESQHDLLQLERDEQRIHDYELSQMNDDIIYHVNASTDQIIASFENADSSSDEECFNTTLVQNPRSDWWEEPPESSEADLYRDFAQVEKDYNLDCDTESEDNHENAAQLAELLDANIKLLTFLQEQNETIARLQLRIVKLKSRIHNLSFRSEIPSSDTAHIAHSNPKISDQPTLAVPTVPEFDSIPQPNDDNTTSLATVLVDTTVDTSFLLQPNSESAITMGSLNYSQIQKQLANQLAEINGNKNNRDDLWMFFDSGASRSVISTTSPVRPHIQNIGPAYGSCSIGDGTPLHYLEKGKVTDNLEVTVVKDLKFDLFSAVNAAKHGLSSVIDYDLQTGQNQSFTIDKRTGSITPLVERGKGILELPLHLMLPSKACVSVSQDKPLTQDALPPHIVSMFWHHYDDASFDPLVRENNTNEYSLFTFDIIKSLSDRERHFLIHARLGHLPRQKILQMIKNGTTGIGDYTGKFKELCKPCLQAKQRAEDHGKEHKRHPKSQPGEHLHSDLAVLSTVDINGNKYVLTVVDEISHEIVIALLKRKTAEDVHRVCQKIQLSITARTGNKLLTWQFDRGTEFLNSVFEKWLKMGLGVTQRFSNIEHPWENGMAERSFQTLFSITRSLLKHADLPDRLWGKAILHSTYITNRSPSAALGGIAPLQFRTKQPIDLTALRVFGSPAQIFVRATSRLDKKLSDRSVSGTFVGMSDKGNGYIFLIDRSNDIAEVDSKDVKFNETFSDYRGRQGKIMSAPFIAPDLRDESGTSTEGQQRNDQAEDNKDKRQQERPKRNTYPRRFLLPGTNTTHESEIGHQQYSTLCSDNIVDQREAIFIMQCMQAPLDEETTLLRELELLTACITYNENEELLMSTINAEVNLSIPDPKSQSEIDRMDPRDAQRFNEATITEVNGMKGKQVFVNTTLDDLPPNTKIYQSVVNWTSKTNLGVYVKTKCRICFGGHMYDKSYSDTFAPTVNFCTVLVIICLSAMFGWIMGGIDYSQAYLNADIDEICVMRAPISVREYDSRGKEYYWLLKKAIYGHPKASRLWAECLHNKLLKLGYVQFLTDQCVYGRWTHWDLNDIHNNIIPKHSSFVFLLIHSDDIIITSHDPGIMNAAKAELLKAFEGTDNGTLTSFCGVEIKSNEERVSLSMEYYWDKLMRKFNVKSDEVENAPLKTKIKRSDCPKEADVELKNSYLQIIGSIIYGYTHCRLDLAFPVNMLTRIMHSPAEQHFNLLKKLLHYINGTKKWTLNYFRDETVYYGMDFVFFCNVDSAHADDDESHRSTGGWFFFLRKGQGAVAAKSGQTNDIPLSSTESETIWGSNAAKQGAFLKQFLDETRLFRSTAFEMHEDSQPMINAQKRNVSQSRFKHMRTKHHYIRKLIFDGWCKLIKISSKMNTADMATKILPATQVSIFSKIVLGLQDSLLYFTEYD